jgi:plasmid replication initiation protein
MKEEITIKQSNDLIRALPFKDNDFRLSLTQKRALYFFIQEIISKNYDHRNGPNWIQVDCDKLINTICPEKGGRRGQNSTLMALEELDKFRNQKYKIVLRYFDEDNNEIIRHSQWVLEMETVVASGKIDLHFPDIIVSNILNLKGFYTAIPLEAVLEAKSSNQIRLYELLLSYASLGKVSLSPDKIKEYLEIKKNAYAKFKHFKEKVLDVCCKYINEQNLIHVDFDVIRDDRQRPISIDFNIKYLKELNKKSKKWEKKDVDNLIKNHKDYWETNHLEFTGLHKSDAYLQSDKGDVIVWSDKDFLTRIEKYKKTEDSKNNELPRETNIFVEAMRLMTANQARQRIVNRINKKKEQGIYTNWRVDEMRHKGTNPEAIAVFLVGRASKENEPELEDIYTEIYGEGWREEANRRLEKRGVNL